MKFSFDFEQFFPNNDPDLEFFKTFIEDFETDDNFMLVALRRDEGVFEQNFLEKVHAFTVAAKGLPYVVESQSLTKFAYPLKTPFGITTIPAIHINEPEKYAADQERILQDERLVYNLINEDATALVVALKTTESIDLFQSRELIPKVDSLVQAYNFEQFHYLGRPYFQKELVAMQQREVVTSAVVSAILVSLIMFWLFRKPWGIGIALVSIGLGLLLFMGLLGITGRELNAMSALYPVLMIIVGTSDVIHIMSKYIDELKKGKPRKAAIITTIKEIGLATLLTSATTAIGFASLLSSRIQPIRDFGINAAIGVFVAYITVIGLTTVILSMFHTDKLIKLGRSEAFWGNWMDRFYHFTIRQERGIIIGGITLLILCGVGIAQITTNYNIINNMPNGRKITEDFVYFQERLTSFRPMEVAVLAQDGHKVDEYEVLREVNKVEQHLKEYEAIRGIISSTMLYKTLNQMHNSNRVDAYEFPEDERAFKRYQRLADKLPQLSNTVLENKDKTKARISSRVSDIGADTLTAIGQRIDRWVAANTDTSLVKFQRTGTGLIIDKNAEYVRRSLLLGLGGAMLIVSFLMVLLFRDLKLLLISLVPNMVPLLLAGALLGYLGIELEAGVAIVFAVIFGIAVDDTIHFLSKFKLARDKNKSIEEALHITFLETGKAICLTSVILFFGFLVMLFSIHPPSVTIGLLISLTLVSALFSDLLFIPLLIRWLMRD
ncbi:MAG: MMPL family transporter [Bacteroidota bacterium]